MLCMCFNWCFLMHCKHCKIFVGLSELQICLAMWSTCCQEIKLKISLALHLKGILNQKNKYCYHLLSLMSYDLLSPMKISTGIKKVIQVYTNMTVSKWQHYLNFWINCDFNTHRSRLTLPHRLNTLIKVIKLNWGNTLSLFLFLYSCTMLLTTTAGDHGSLMGIN